MQTETFDLGLMEPADAQKANRSSNNILRRIRFQYFRFWQEIFSKIFVIIKTFEFLKNCAPIQLLKNYNLLDGAQASNGATFHIVGNEIDSCIEFCKWNNGTTMQVEQCTARCLEGKKLSLP